MFTGIVQALVEVESIDHQPDMSCLRLALGDLCNGLETGASVAVNGTCLTVTEVGAGSAHFDIVAETLRTTNLGRLAQGERVNVERSFKVGDEVGGHIVSGHVTGTARLLQRDVKGHDHVVRLTLEPQWGNFVFHKGFIAVDGASLTVSRIDREGGFFEISLIPETLARTTLGSLEAGDLANIEVDSQSVAAVTTIERMFEDPAWQKRLQGLLASSLQVS